MQRQTGLTITISILAVLVLILALQLQEPDSTLMRFFNLKTASRRLLHHGQPQAQRTFTSRAAQAASFSTSTSKMASADNNKEVSAKDTTISESQGGTPLGLPAPPLEGEAIKLDMSSGGDTVRLDSLGPMVVNKDGTISRIGNWEQMTEMERKNTLRIVGKRNKQRLDVLKAAEEGTVEDK